MIKRTTFLTLLACTPLVIHGMGKTEKGDETQGPAFISLHSDQGIYNGVIVDNRYQTPVTKLSFAGETIVDGIKNKNDHSSNRVNMADIAQLTMINPAYDFKNQDYCLMRVTTLTGAQEDLLFPRKLIVCAQAQASKIEKSWYIESITAINFDHDAHDVVQTKTVHAPTTTQPVQSQQNVHDEQHQEVVEVLSDLLT